jgi:D-glycero-D-manno-heptose 1,7-bisphosphate phosphatase
MLVLLDRDGVINEDTPTGVLRFEEFRLLPGAIDAIVRLSRAGFQIAVCTNQSAIGKGWTTHEIVHQVHEYLRAQVIAAGGKIDEIYYAWEAPEMPSLRRKPAPGMLLEALAQFSADPAMTPFVGDMWRDLEAAYAAGCPRMLVRTGKGAALEAEGISAHLQPVIVTDTIATAADEILRTYSAYLHPKE